MQTERERGSLMKVNTQLKEKTEEEIGCLCKQTAQLQEKLVQVKSPVARMKVMMIRLAFTLDFHRTLFSTVS